MKIALVYQELTIRGGGQRLLLTQAKLLQGIGYDVTVFTPAYSSEVYPDLAKSIRLEVIPAKKSPLLEQLPMLNRTLSRLKTDPGWCPPELAQQDLIIGYTYPSNLTAYRAHIKWDIPVIWHCTHPSYWLYPRNQHDRGLTVRSGIVQQISRVPLRIVDKRASTAFSHILVISTKIGERVKRIYGLPSTVLFPCVDPAEFATASLEPEESNSILYVGRLAWSKGPDLFLRVLKGVVSKISDANGIMVLVGQGTPSNLLDTFNRAIVRMNLQGHVELVARAESEKFDMAQFYRKSNLVAYTCRDEDFGLVPLEASLCGRPSVVWDDCGCVQDKILQDNKGTLVAPHYNIEEFIDRVLRLLWEPSLRRELSVNAQASTLRYCDPDVHVSQLQRIIESSL